MLTSAASRTNVITKYINLLTTNAAWLAGGREPIFMIWLNLLTSTQHGARNKIK
jgi:hypothetical protein